MAKIPDVSIQAINGMLFPDMEKTPKAEKLTPRYSLQVMKAIYGQYANNQGDVPFSGLDQYIDSLRIIARGRQTPDQYQKYFTDGKIPSLNVLTDRGLEASEADASRKGWFTGMWETFNPIVNMKTMAKGKFLNQDADIKCNIVDADATIGEIERVNQEWVKTKFRPLFNYLRTQIGLPEDNSSSAGSYQELVDIKNEGAFKDRFVIAIEELLKHTEDISDWSMTLKEKLFDDIFDIGVAFALADYDPTECKVIWKYLDVKDAGVQYSFQKDFKDSQMFYWFEYWNMNKVRQRISKFKNSDDRTMQMEDLENLASKYKTYQQNINSLWFNEKQPDNYNMSDMTVCVMRGRWMDVEKTKYSEYVKGSKPKQVKYSEGQENNKAYNITEDRELRRYDATWIVGSDFVSEYGPAKNQAFKNKNQPTLGFAAFKLMEKSYIERLTPIAHLFAIAFIKFTNALAKAQDDFIDFDADKLAQMTDGGKKYEPLEMIRVMRQENLFIHSSEGMDHSGGDDSAVRKVEGTIGSIVVHLDLMERYLRLAEMQTGISPTMIGATPDPNTPVRTAQMSMNSTDISMSVLTHAVMKIKTDLAEQSIPMIKNLLDIDPDARTNYGRVVGIDDIESIIESEGQLDNMGIKLFPRPTREMVDRILRYAELSIQRGDIDPISVAELDYHIERGGNFLQMLYKLQNEIKKERDRKDKQQLAVQKQIADGQAQQQQIQNQAEMKMQQERTQMEGVKANNKAMTAMLVDDNKFLDEMKGLVIKDAQDKGMDPKTILADMQVLIDQRKQQLAQAG